MTARFYADLPLAPGLLQRLPDAVARHVQVLRLQPGGHLTLFNGRPHNGHAEGEFDAVVERMGRSSVDVSVGAFTPTARQAGRTVHLLVGMPANERMDWLVEKATELGAASVQPLMTERSVLRLKAERADKKLAHWRGVAVAACEQSGRNRVPVIHDVMTLADWLSRHPPGPSAHAARALLSLQTGTRSLAALAAAPAGELSFLSGPEGGLGPQEEAAALANGFVAVTLGPCVLRAETAPLACLAFLALLPAAAG